MSIPGGNRLPDLAARITDLHRQVLQHQQEAAEKALAAGQALCEAKVLAGHGNWAGWLAGIGIGERTAQRYMRLWKSGLNPTLLSDLGGVTGTLAFLAKWTMPDTSNALFIYDDGKEPGEGDSAWVWQADRLAGYFHIGMIIEPGDDQQILVTNRPMPPLIEIDGDQPIDAVLETILQSDFSPRISAWTVETVDRRLPDIVLGPTLERIGGHTVSEGRKDKAPH